MTGSATPLPAQTVLKLWQHASVQTQSDRGRSSDGTVERNVMEHGTQATLEAEVRALIGKILREDIVTA